MQFNHVWRQQTLRCNFFKHLYKFSSTFQGILFFFQANYIFKHFSSTRVKIQALFQSVLHPEYALSPPLIITTQHCQWCIGVNIGYTPPLKIPHPPIIANLCANISRENRYDYFLEDLPSKLDDKTKPATQLLFQKFVQANKENIKAQNQWSFVRGLWLDCCFTKTSQPIASYTKFWIQMDIYELVYS